ncbi:MAG TPA: glycosyltransferase family 4 protein, partial [Pelobium sp.]|nr:glycosyltransferase family 4 protein [Pelobium sp.]
SIHVKTITKALGEIKTADVLHLNSLFNPLSFISFFYTKLFYPNKKIVWSVRGELSPGALKFSRWKKKPLLFLYKKLCDKVVFHSTSLEETNHIKKRFPENKVVFIPNLIQPSQRIGVPKEKKILYVGRIHPIKALHKLLKALHLSDLFKNSEFTFEIVGTYEERHRYYFDELNQLISKYKLEKKVFFKGHITGEAKEKKYAEAYFLVLPSETENFGNVVVEALNQGTPVIASKGTPWKILEEHQAGFHTENIPAVMSKKIDKVLNISETTHKKFSKNAIRLVDENFNVDTQIHQWIDCYKDL